MKNKVHSRACETKVKYLLLFEKKYNYQNNIQNIPKKHQLSTFRIVIE